MVQPMVVVIMCWRQPGRAPDCGQWVLKAGGIGGSLVKSLIVVTGIDPRPPPVY